MEDELNTQRSSKRRKYKIDTDRLERGITQTMPLIKEEVKESELLYKVRGTQKKIYDIILDNEWSCTCPDFLNRGELCKHIYFILKRVLHYGTEELKEGIEDHQVFKQASDVAKKHQRLAAEYRKSGKDKKVQMKPISECDCCICCEEFETESEIIYCKSVCGKPLHKACYQIWSEVSETCPNCRTPMDSSETDEEGLNKFL